MHTIGLDCITHTHNKLYGTAPLLRYNGEENFDLWQKRARLKLRQLLGMPETACEDRFCLEYEKQHTDYTEYRFVFQSEPDFYVPCHLLVPFGPRRPLAICLQGHAGGGMYLSMGIAKTDFDREMLQNRDGAIGLRAMQEGYAALLIEQRCLGEQGQADGSYSCHLTALDSLAMGQTLTGLRVWDVQQALTVTEKYFSGAVRTDRTICLGNSIGGHVTLYTAALDLRIKAIIPSCTMGGTGPTAGEHKHCPCGIIPGRARYFDMGDIGGLVAPRPMVIVAGSEDPMVPAPLCAISYELLHRLYYPAAGAPQNCVYRLGEGGHRFYADLAWPALHSIFTAAPFSKA